MWKLKDFTSGVIIAKQAVVRNLPSFARRMSSTSSVSENGGWRSSVGLCCSGVNSVRPFLSTFTWEVVLFFFSHAFVSKCLRLLANTQWTVKERSQRSATPIYSSWLTVLRRWVPCCSSKVLSYSSLMFWLAVFLYLLSKCSWPVEAYLLLDLILFLFKLPLSLMFEIWS